MKRPAAVLAFALLGAPLAQADDIDQGEARITTRSDVTMAIESGPRTTSMKLQAIAGHLGRPLGDVKRCYGAIVKDSPDVHGHINVALTYPPKGPLKVGLNAQGVQSTKLERCVQKTFAALNLSDVGRPANATVKLSFTNTAADAAHHVEEKREEMAQVDIKTEEDGTLYSQDGTADGKVAFRVEAPAKVGAEAIGAAHHGLEHALPRLLDCRRRASKRDSPEGDVKLRVILAQRGKPKVSAVSSSVKHPNAKTCAQTALRRARFDPGHGRVLVTVHFNE